MRKPVKKSDKVPTSEFSDTFVQGMYDRMAVSYFKYGAVAKAYPDKVDAIASLNLRLERYAETGNSEWLMDVANFAMIEYMRPRHPKAHFKGTDGDTTGRVTTKGVQSTKHNLDIKQAAREPSEAAIDAALGAVYLDKDRVRNHDILREELRHAVRAAFAEDLAS